MKVSRFAVLKSAVLVIVLIGEVHVSQAATCNPLELSPCLPAITSPSTPPSTLCCSRLKEQQPCFCGYIKDPNLGHYVSSPGAKRVAAACQIPCPKC